MDQTESSGKILRPPRLLAFVLLVSGLWFAARGGQLAMLGGSPYYLLTGLALMTCGGLAFAGKPGAARGYAVILGITVIWALWESGPDWWALAPRLVLPLVLGGWFLLPRTRRRLGHGGATFSLVLKAGAACILAGLALNATYGEKRADPVFQTGLPTGVVRDSPAGGLPQDMTGDWLHYGSDPGGQRYSTLSQITPENVEQLEIAWIYHLGPTPKDAPDKFEATPIKVNDALYFCTPASDVIALDAETGKEKWRYRSGTKLGGSTVYGACRGVSYYALPGKTGVCSQRIYSPTLDARLIALDAASGVPCAGFGKAGIIDLTAGMGKVPLGYYFVTSAPTIIHGKLVMGGWVADAVYIGEPSGVIRAFDAETGELVWAFDLARPDRQGTPPPGETYTHSTPNSWAPMSADPDLGLVYAPLGGSIPDYTGTERRPFDEAWSGTVVALDAQTGRPRWKFQTVHHDLWDYDVPAQPTLIDLRTSAGLRKALVQPTKRGEMFVLDRATGEPIFPVSEHRVPTRGAIPGERVAPAQPFSDAMPSFRGPDLTEGQMWGLTPIDQLECRIAFRRASYDGTMTPPRFGPSLSSPGFLGGSDWGGVAVDPARQVMIVNSNRMANILRLIPRTEADRMGVKPRFAESAGQEPTGEIRGILPQLGTPAAAEIAPFLSPLAAPCQQPPWGHITAVDLTSGKVIWNHRIGTARDSGPLGVRSGIPLTIGTPSMGGTVTTVTGLFFLSGTQDHYIRAISVSDGRVLWRSRLPSGGQANPMTYMSRASGRQFVAVAAGGHQIALGKSDDYLIAYALPTRKR